MASVVTISANTAAYAAQAIKPSQRVRGDAEIEEAITLLGIETKAKAEIVQSAIALRRPTSLSLLLMSSHGQLPQGTANQAISRYLENSGESEPVEDPQEAGRESLGDNRDEPPQEEPAAPVWEDPLLDDAAAS